ncbi:MAG: alcohol dehydrogenase catalytic domain-containing protein [Bacteroidetes bacterium]|nr:alcohol dehydrogenase catalytic domain-containing protein [Bacteroidota bacterium]
MIALQYKEYGDASVLNWDVVSNIELKSNEARILVKATGIKSYDIKIRRGEFDIFKKIQGFLPHGMGLDFAGIITDLGDMVKGFKLGDKVYGCAGIVGGCYADYVKLDAKRLYYMPENLSFAEASTLPINGHQAIAMVNQSIKPEGKKILIHGTSEGAELFVAQLCKAKGAKVTVFCDGRLLNKYKNLGIESCYNIHNTRLNELKNLYDAIVDFDDKLEFDELKRSLKKGGEVFVSKSNYRYQRICERIGDEYGVVNLITQPTSSDIENLTELISSEQIKCSVSQIFPLSNAIHVLKQIDMGLLDISGEAVLVA